MQDMTAPWLDSRTPVGPPTAANPRVRNLLYAAAVTGGWAGLLCLIVYVIGRLAGVPLEVQSPGDTGLAVIPWLTVLLLPLAAATAAAMLAALARGRRHAERLVFWLGTLIALASCLAPIIQPTEVYWSTRILLLVMQLITWALVVPQIARIVGDSEPGRHVERSR